MVFNVPNQALKCGHCDTDMQIDEYDLSNVAEEDKDTYTVTVYKCPNCGAELARTIRRWLIAHTVAVSQILQ